MFQRAVTIAAVDFVVSRHSIQESQITENRYPQLLLAGFYR
jgi:hypothetical protein